MTTIAMPICLGCTHYDRTAPGPGIRCTAFPDGVPDGIYLSAADHRQPFEGDRGIRFEPIEEADAAYAELLFSPVSEDLPEVAEAVGEAEHADVA